jgi:hypothetical protein
MVVAIVRHLDCHMAATANDSSHTGLVGLMYNVIIFNFRLLYFSGT